MFTFFAFFRVFWAGDTASRLLTSQQACKPQQSAGCAGRLQEDEGRCPPKQPVMVDAAGCCSCCRACSHGALHQQTQTQHAVVNQGCSHDQGGLQGMRM